MTLFLTTANLVFFAYEIWLMLQGSRALDIFLSKHALIPARLMTEWREPASWLTVLSSMFLHGSGAHVLGNVWFLWVFGRSVENHLGPGRFLVLYAISGIGAAALQTATGPFSAIPMIGASGAISGVLGAYFVLFPKAWIVTLVPWIVPILPVPAFVFLILWFLLQTTRGMGALLEGPATGGVAWWAHVGGFLAGVIGARMFVRPGKRRR